MPIYSYRCEQCGHQQDVLQKMSDPLLVTCPACGADAYRKQVTAAGFQLKGSGWYVTDFRDPPATKDAGKPASKDGETSPPPAGAPAPSASPESSTASTSASPAPAPAPAKVDPPATKPAPSSGTS